MAGISLAVEGAVALVTIENPEVRNGLTPELAGELVDVCAAVDGDSKIGAAVLRGAGGTFCSGADTRVWSAEIDWTGEEGHALLGDIYAAFVRVGKLEVPTIAAVRGAAVGAGLNLMLACDLRVVARDARLMAGFLRIGLHPGGGFFTLLSRVGNPQLTAAVGLFGEELDGEAAARLGLAWESLEDSEVEERALALAAVAARDPLLARRATQCMRQEIGPPAMAWDAAVAMERQIQAWSLRRRFDAAVAAQR